MRSFTRKTIPIVSAVASATLLVACSGTPETNSSLTQAQEAVNRAAQDPQVAQYAPDELRTAQNTLDMAQRGWDEYGDKRLSDVNHLSYVAEKQALTAIELATANQTRADIANASERRTQAMLAASEQEAEALRQELHARETERGLVLTMDQILFETGGATLQPGGVNAIQRLGDFLKANPNRSILIEGHTDSSGSDQLNLNLSQQRAEAVKQQLVQFGVPNSQVKVRGYGEEFPIASNATPAGRQQNRRVEVVIANEGEEPEYRTSSRTSSR